jgi:hypothetical protein
MNLDALIEAERNAPAGPSATESRRLWTSIHRSAIAAPLTPLAAGKATALAKLTAVLSTTTGKVVVAAAVVTAAATGTQALQSPAPTPPAARQTANEAPQRKSPAKAKPKRPDTATPPVKAATLVPTPPAVQETSAVPIQRPTATPPATPVVAPKPEPEPNAEPEDAPLIADGRLLVQRAEKALKQRKFDVALHFLRRHRKLYANSPLEERREADFVLALCGAKRSLAAKARWNFNRRWPTSAYRDTLGKACKRRPKK